MLKEEIHSLGEQIKPDPYKQGFLDGRKQGYTEAAEIAENTGISTDDLLKEESKMQGVCRWWEKVKANILNARDQIK